MPRLRQPQGNAGLLPIPDNSDLLTLPIPYTVKVNIGDLHANGKWVRDTPVLFTFPTEPLLRYSMVARKQVLEEGKKVVSISYGLSQLSVSLVKFVLGQLQSIMDIPIQGLSGATVPKLLRAWNSPLEVIAMLQVFRALELAPCAQNTARALEEWIKSWFNRFNISLSELKLVWKTFGWPGNNNEIDANLMELATTCCVRYATKSTLAAAELKGLEELKTSKSAYYQLFKTVAEKMWYPGWLDLLLDPTKDELKRGADFRTNDQAGPMYWDVHGLLPERQRTLESVHMWYTNGMKECNEWRETAKIRGGLRDPRTWVPARENSNSPPPKPSRRSRRSSLDSMATHTNLDRIPPEALRSSLLAAPTPSNAALSPREAGQTPSKPAPTSTKANSSPDTTTRQGTQTLMSKSSGFIKRLLPPSKHTQIPPNIEPEALNPPRPTVKTSNTTKNAQRTPSNTESTKGTASSWTNDRSPSHNAGMKDAVTRSDLAPQNQCNVNTPAKTSTPSKTNTVAEMMTPSKYKVRFLRRSLSCRPESSTTKSRIHIRSRRNSAIEQSVSVGDTKFTSAEDSHSGREFYTASGHHDW